MPDKNQLPELEFAAKQLEWQKRVSDAPAVADRAKHIARNCCDLIAIALDIVNHIQDDTRANQLAVVAEIMLSYLRELHDTIDEQSFLVDYLANKSA